MFLAWGAEIEKALCLILELNVTMRSEW